MKIFASRENFRKSRVSHEKAASREVQSRKFSRVTSESPKLLDELATGELPAESRKTLTPVFQHITCLNNEKQSKH